MNERDNNDYGTELDLAAQQAELEQEGRDAVAAGERAEEIRETPLGEEIDGGNDHVADEIYDGGGWPGDGSGTDDLADYNANEADDYRDE